MPLTWLIELKTDVDFSLSSYCLSTLVLMKTIEGVGERLYNLS